VAVVLVEVSAVSADGLVTILTKQFDDFSTMSLTHPLHGKLANDSDILWTIA
jgi:hypothetical protein